MALDSTRALIGSFMSRKNCSERLGAIMRGRKPSHATVSRRVSNAANGTALFFAASPVRKRRQWLPWVQPIARQR